MAEQPSARQASKSPDRGSEPPSGPLILLDGMSLAFRAYFALPNTLTTADGVVTNAVHGFASMVVNLIRDHRPVGLAVAFDLPGGTFRDEIVEEYKGGRAETPPDLPPQFEMIRSLLASLAIPVVEAQGFEADDVLATLATEARDRRHPVIIVTGDRDSYQLVEDPYIRVLYNRRGVSEYALYDEAGIEERTGVEPALYPLLAALRGDPSDNLPGVPGVGEKTAAKLINEYGDLEAIYAHLDALSPKLRENLATHLDRVRKNAEVIPLVRDVPLDVHVDQLTLGGWELEEARRTFAELELRTLWTRFSALMQDGYLGKPATRATGVAGAPGPGSLDGPGAVAAEAMPDWLASPSVAAPRDAASACEALEAVFASARATTGSVALSARWSGDAGRSPLVGLAVTSEAVGDGRPPGPVVYLGPGADPEIPLLAEPEVLEALAGGLGAGGVGVVAHDAKEFMRSLLPLGVDVTDLTMDTAVAAYLLDPSNDRYRVTDLGARFLGVAVDDGGGGKGQGSFLLEPPPERSAGPGTSDTPHAPGVSDAPADPVDALAMVEVRLASVLAKLRAPLLEALAGVGESTLFDEIERPLVRVLARMEVVGIPVDREVLRSIAAGLAEECRELEATIHELAGGPFKINSVPQLRSVLYEQLGLTPARKTKTGFSTDARTLELLRGQHPIIEALLRYREIEKLRSTYGESLAAEVAPDGRIHATFRQTVARTGRLSSDRPNLHNIPVRTEEGRRFREAFVPSAGRRLLVADYDQVELRAIAHLSGDPGLTSAFAAGEDIHRTVAARVFGVDRDKVTHAQRSTAKMVSYGLAYGMEAYGLSQRLAIPVEEAQEILGAFFEAFPSVHDYMERAVAEARATGYTVTAFGRRRPLPDLTSTNYQVRQAAERQAMNAGIQGLAADLFKVALIRLDAGLEEGGFDSDLVLQVHDEVLVDVVPEESDRVAALTERALTGAAQLAVPLKVAMAWGSSWAEAKGA
ncbi:MAG TPA: DNA polymerase I [Acidimicrobiales bacterium]|nr:DNA polymerase I [Acidimicrobiales bacterium]